jgi:ABC-type bacteriocin/lantibiotic exporter with double-glycine peptidase domain
MLVWRAQEFPSSCVAACVRMVFGELGTQMTEAQVRQLIGYSPLGVALAAAETKLVEAGAIASFHDDWSLADLRDALREGLHPIVGVERHLLGYPGAFHAIVLVEITSAAVTALDPLDGPGLRSYGLPSFEVAWETAGREALLIETPSSGNKP